MEIDSFSFSVLQSNRELYYYYPKNPNPNTGVFAIRNNRYKVHFRTQG